MSHLDLYQFALDACRVAAERRELTKVSDETGLDYSWLSKFSRGKIPGASYQRVSTLADYFAQRAPPMAASIRPPASAP